MKVNSLFLWNIEYRVIWNGCKSKLTEIDIFLNSYLFDARREAMEILVNFGLVSFQEENFPFLKKLEGPNG